MTERATKTTATTTANRRIVSRTYMVRRSGKVMVTARRLTLLSLGFQFLFDRSKSLFKRRASLVDRDFAHNAPFETSQARLLGALQGNQVEAVMVWAL